MKIQYLGHAAFYFEFGGSKFVVDPFIRPNPLASTIDIEKLEADYILITHGHEDHVSDVEEIAKRTQATLVSNYEIISWFGEKGIQGHPMNFGGKKLFDFGWLKYVQACHSSVLPDGTYGGNPGGFVLWNAKESIYIAGDTALTLDLQLIPRTCPKLDIAILPIGDNFTMGYEDAVIASDFIECNKIIGCHFDTFGYIEIDHEAAKNAFTDAGKELILLAIGENIEL